MQVQFLPGAPAFASTLLTLQRHIILMVRRRLPTVARKRRWANDARTDATAGKPAKVTKAGGVNVGSLPAGAGIPIGVTISSQPSDTKRFDVREHYKVWFLAFVKQKIEMIRRETALLFPEVWKPWKSTVG